MDNFLHIELLGHGYRACGSLLVPSAITQPRADLAETARRAC